MHRKPTLDDVAGVAGVSRASVSRVINGQTQVAPEIRDRVREAVERLGYRPDPAARALARGHGDVVELVVIDNQPTNFGTNTYYGRLVAGIVDAIRPTDAQMRVHVVRKSDAPRLLDRIARTASVGAVLVNVTPEQAESFYTVCDRVVVIGRAPAPIPCVHPDDEAGAYAAVRMLQRGGRKRIAAIHGPQYNSSARDRQAGYLEAMRDGGLDPLDGGAGEFSRETGVERTRELLATDPDVDALFAACDLMASGAMQVLAGAGRRVPEDVAVVGFDDSIIATCTTPPMTSVRQPVEEMAAAAARALLAGEVRAGWHTTFPTTLSVRDSS